MNPKYYSRYISSPEWKKKREARLAIDKFRCRLCDEDGTLYRLEVHHKPSSYDRVPNESVEDDLTTLCVRCHDMITNVVREDRYGKRVLEVETIQPNVDIRQEIKNHGMANFAVQIDFVSPINHAQRADGRPSKQVGEIDKTDFIKAKEDRFGLRRDGSA